MGKCTALAAPLRKAGYIRDESETYVHFGDPGKPVACYFTAAATMDPNLMVRGQTIPPNSVRAVPIHIARVSYPSLKGAMYPEGGGSSMQWNWCCTTPTISPVAFFDGGVVEASWVDLSPTGDLDVENYVGYPVYSTWNGVRGRDR